MNSQNNQKEQSEDKGPRKPWAAHTCTYIQTRTHIHELTHAHKMKMESRAVQANQDHIDSASKQEKTNKK